MSFKKPLRHTNIWIFRLQKLRPGTIFQTSAVKKYSYEGEVDKYVIRCRKGITLSEFDTDIVIQEGISVGVWNNVLTVILVAKKDSILEYLCTMGNASMESLRELWPLMIIWKIAIMVTWKTVKIIGLKDKLSHLVQCT